MSKVDINFRYIIIGDVSCGKTSLLYSLLNYDNTKNFQSTIGVDFGCKSFNINKNLVKILIWDTAGLERFRTITQSYYNKGDVVIIVYDINNRQSFNNLNYWFEQVDQYCKKNVTIVLIGNKTDKDTREVSTEEVEKFISNRNILFFEVSAYNKEEVYNIFYKSCQLKYMEYTNDNILSNRENNIKLKKKSKILKYCGFS